MGEFSTAVMEKDLQLRMRGWRWAGVTTLYAGILAAITVTFLLHRYSLVGSQALQAGIHLFQALAIGELLLITFVAPASAAGAITGERQHRTWDLLVASRASVWSIVGGKLLAAVAFNLVLIATTLPLFALVFLFGGMTLAAMVPSFAVFLVTVLFLSATSTVVSSLTSRLTVSYMISMLIALLLVVGLAILSLYTEAAGQLGVVAIGGLPFQTGSPAAPLPAFAQLSPLVALLSAMPSDSGGTVLGSLGTIHHAFGLPGKLPLWGAYVVLGAVSSVVLAMVAVQLSQLPPAFRPLRAALPLAREGGT